MGERDGNMTTNSMNDNERLSIQKQEKSNIEKLVDFAEHEDPTLIPVFLAVVEMCFDGKIHSL